MKRSGITVIMLAFALALLAPSPALADGTLDKTFGDEGSTIFDPVGGGADDYAAGLTIDGQGRAVVVGTIFLGMAPSQAFIARFTPTGEPDASFSGDGYLQLTSAGSATLDDVLIDGQGRIVAIGDQVNGATWDLAVVRFLPDGTPDTSFSGDGLYTADFGGTFDTGAALDLDPQGRIVAAGQTDAGGTFGALVIRINGDGSFDSGFNGSGFKPPVGGTSSSGADVVVDGNGRIFVTGNRTVPPATHPYVARLLGDGALDAAYSGDGFTVVDFGLRQSEGVEELKLDAAGRAVIGGTVGATYGEYDPAFARLTPAGLLDPEFGNGGTIGSPVEDDYFLLDFEIDRVGRLIAVGGFAKALGPFDLTIQRFTDSGIDPTFGDDGTLFDDFFQEGADARASAIDSAGRVLVAGRAINPSPTGTRIVLARYTMDYPAPPEEPPPPLGPGVKCAGQTATITGTAGKDRLGGTKKRDVIAGLGGNDVVKGLGGNDLVCGGAGGDRLLGGPGKDTLRGDGGRDRLLGGPGKDRLVGGKGRDRCVAGPVRGRLSSCERRR